MKAKRFLSALLTALLVLAAAAVPASASVITEPSPAAEAPAASGNSQSELPADHSRVLWVNPMGPGLPSAAQALPEEFHFSSEHYASAPTLTSREEIIKYLRAEMKNRSSEIIFYCPTSLMMESEEEPLQEFFDAAMAHTGVPDEGDYLRYTMEFMSANWVDNMDGTAWVRFGPIQWRTTAAEEKTVDARVKTLVSQLGLTGTSKTDYQKVKAIYDYITDHVVYDYEHLYEPSYVKQFTAYAALIDEYAVCMGYSLLFYRLALEAGIDARFIASIPEENHAWNIVELNGLYYNLDSTWDAGFDDHIWFLLNEEHFHNASYELGYTKHTRDPAFLFPECPMALNDYDPDSPEGLTPKISSVTVTASGIQISWPKIAGASEYTLFYKTGSGSWQTLTTTSSTSYTWKAAKSGTKYTFMVRPRNAAGKIFGTMDKTGKSIAYYATPKISDLTTSPAGVKITWGAVGGASKYTVFYKTGSGSWQTLTTTTATSYTWKSAKVGTKYTFTVRPRDSAGKIVGAIDSTGKSITHTGILQVSKVSTTLDGIKITWEKVSGASKYSVFYKTGSGSWQSLASSTSTSYTWKKAKSGTAYSFMVRPRDSANKLMGAIDKTGKSITYYATPKISSVSSTASGVKISWGKITGASKYTVFYKTGTGSWKSLYSTSSTSYTWPDAKSGTAYTFMVRPKNSAGTIVGAIDNTGKSLTYYATPRITSLTNTDSGIEIVWGAVGGAEKYTVFYKTVSGSWQSLYSTSSTSYIWPDAKSGTEYTFMVRPKNSEGKIVGAIDNTGKSITA